MALVLAFGIRLIISGITTLYSDDKIYDSCRLLFIRLFVDVIVLGVLVAGYHTGMLMTQSASLSFMVLAFSHGPSMFYLAIYFSHELNKSQRKKVQVDFAVPDEAMMKKREESESLVSRSTDAGSIREKNLDLV